MPFVSGAFIVVAGLVLGFAAYGYYKYRSVLRHAKGIERGLKMVPLLIHLPPSSDDTEIGTRDVRDVIQEKISQAEILYSVLATTVTKGWKSKFYGQRHIAFEIIGSKGIVNFYAAVPVALVEVVKQAVLSAYPTARLEEVEEHNIFSPTGKITGTIGGELSLRKEYSYPIATFQETKRDNMQSILNALSSLGPEDGAAIQILIRPAPEHWTKKSTSIVSKTRKNKGKASGLAIGGLKGILAAPFKPPEAQETKPEDKQLTNLEQGIVDAVEQKTTHPGYEALIRVIASSNTANKSQSILQNLLASFALFEAQGRNGFKFSPAKDIESFVSAFIFRFFPPEVKNNILNSVELATIFHFPDQQFTVTSQLQRQASKQVDGPHNISHSGLLLGHNVFRGVKKEVRLSIDDRRRHMYVIGQTGTGKSVLLENLALQDMLDGNGFAFIDPHGDAVENLLAMVPKERTEDVIYFNPADMDFPLGLNLFEFQTPEQKDFLIQEAINMLYKLYDPGHTGIIGPRYEHWFRNASLTLMSDPKGATFIEIPKVFTDNQYAKEKLKHVTDPTVLDFWNKEMAQTSDYHKSEVLGWFVSKFGAFMSNEMMRNIIGQTKSSFDLRKVMDEKKILLVNLSKGRVGELNSKLLGMIFVMKFQAAAMSRANVPQEQRTDFSLYVDEFQNFSTDSFATILSEARKYRLNLLVANQFMSQLTEDIRDAVFGNVGTIVTLRSGASDAEFLVKQFAPTFDTQDLVKLPNYNAIVKLMVGGVPSQPFSMVTMPPLGRPNPQLAIALKQLSAAKFGTPKNSVQQDIFKRLETKPSLPKSPLASRPTVRTNSSPTLPRSSTAPAKSSSSFLDEWLAKRKKQPPAASSRPLSASATGSSPSLQNQAPSTTTTSPPKSQAPPAVEQKFSTEESDNSRLSNVLESEKKNSPTNQNANNSHPIEIKPATTTEASLNPSATVQSPAVIKPQSQQVANGGDQASDKNISSQASSSHNSSIVGTDDDVDKIASVLKDRLNAKEQAADSDPDSTPAADNGIEEKVKNLAPGEVYIDDKGNIYQNDKPKKQGV